MSQYKVKLEVFEGPLGLLLHLIEKNQLDIYNIPIAQVTEQYLEYLKTLEEFNIDIASDFLVMAATLLQIKSRMLLPKPEKVTEITEDDFDPRQELVERLLEYRKFKEMAFIMESMYRKRQCYFSRQPQYTLQKVISTDNLIVDNLLKAFAALWESISEECTFVAREEFSIHDKMLDIITLLHRHGGKLEFHQTLCRAGSRAELIVSFLALLELNKMKRVCIFQETSFSAIMISFVEGGNMSDVLFAHERTY